MRKENEYNVFMPRESDRKMRGDRMFCIGFAAMPCLAVLVLLLIGYLA